MFANNLNTLRHPEHIIMDTLAHALWALAAAKLANLRLKSNKTFKKNLKRGNDRLNVWLSAFFGIAPDIFSFGIWFAFMIFNAVLGNGFSREFHESWNGSTSAVVLLREIVSGMYNLTHSMIVFLIVFGLVYLWKKRFVLEMLGWPLHIMIDIPTHTQEFYPTPFLFPLSNWTFDGISWGQSWFMITNYSLLAITYIALAYFSWKQKKNVQKKRSKKE